ncbi:DNA cytosine methyltransferase [Paracoccus sp. 11-3]|uniref:DNA (cytosine-5-)-methyltransferase n=1 Tax=Paracoccus amoyensis TaxID=2760093 RepID=A0A926GHN2_9RHOB|nr:DNA cytosine methyltransferase [Paracoccus amoyensis]NHF74863.1 DNA cytosine methyltransferase [Paracoccus xiamenensis]
MGLMLAEPGYHTRAFVEWEDWPRSVLIAAQNAGYFAPAPIWDDLRSFDARPFRGAFDTVLAGYPCQPFSAAGKRGGAADPRHLWPEVARVIAECRPEWVSLENVAGHVTLGLETVLRELWGLGYTPAAGLFSAAEVGAPHQRLRIFILAHTDEPASRNHPLQPGGQQRFYPQGGSIGAGHRQLVDAEGQRWVEGRTGSELWLVRNATIASAGGAMVDDTAGTRCQPSGCGSDSRTEGWQPLPGARCAKLGDTSDAMADPGRAELEGQFGSQHHPGGWQKPDGCPALPGGTGLHPPGPGDHAAWATILAARPDLAPALGFHDCLAWARCLAADPEGAGAAAAEPALRRMADGLAHRARALRLLGNGVHPLAAAHAWRTLAAAHGLGPVDLASGGGTPAPGADVPV